MVKYGNLEPLEVKEDIWQDPEDALVGISKFPRKLMFSTSAGDKTFPDQFSYWNMIGRQVNQGGHGTCYFMTACHFAELVVWMHTGKNLPILTEDWYTVLAQPPPGGRGSNQDDWDGGICSNGAMLLNEKLKDIDHPCECIMKFQEIAKSIGINSDLSPTNAFAYGSCTCQIRENVVRALNLYGPCYWSHNPLIYGGGSGSHAIIAVGYDDDFFYAKGSWGQRCHNVAVSWDKMTHPYIVDGEPVTGGSLYFYNKKFMTSI